MAQGTLPIAMQQQFSFTNCATFTNACGTPLQGGLLYFYQAGTVATVQNSFQDTGLTLPNPWPLVLDANGRIPNFYLANGSVHVRLTDSSGIVQFDIPSALVIGPSGGGGGGGGSVDPTTVLSTGDIKFRMTQEFVTGWVKLNAQTIGSASSGATQRANADTQNLYVYLWNNCSSPTSNSSAHCPVSGGLGTNALADFNANKQLQLPDWRGRGPMGVDDMGNAAAGRLVALNVTSGGSDGVTTPGASGGEATHTMTSNDLIPHVHANSLTDPGHNHGASSSSSGSGSGNVSDPGHAHAQTGGTVGTSGTGVPVNSAGDVVLNTNTGAATTGITVPSLNLSLSTSTTVFGNTTGVTINNAVTGVGLPFNQMQPFLLGSWYVKL